MHLDGGRPGGKAHVTYQCVHLGPVFNIVPICFLNI